MSLTRASVPLVRRAVLLALTAAGCYHGGAAGEDDSGSGSGSETADSVGSASNGTTASTNGTTAGSNSTTAGSNTTAEATSGDPTTSDPTTDSADTTGGMVVPSSGCGLAIGDLTHLTQIDAGNHIFSGNANGREYQVDIHPAVFDVAGNNTPQPLFFGIHGCYENIENSRNNLFKFMINGGGDASRPFVAVYPKSEGDCWSNSPNSSDHAYLEEIYAQVYEDLCIDTQAVFFAGQSSGAFEASSLPIWNIYGELPGRTHAVAINAGGLPYRAPLPSPDTVEPVHFFGIHSDIDPVVPVANGRQARDFYLQVDGCSTTTGPLDPPTGCGENGGQGQFACNCVAYDDCSSATPVLWCEHHWDVHYMPDWGPQAILDFFFDVY